VIKPAARKRELLCPRTLRHVARWLAARGLDADHASDPYCIGLATAYRAAMRHCNREARALESRQPRKKARGR
jgi:hypothetical protein